MAVSAKAAIDFESSLAGVAKTTGLAGNAFDKSGSPLAAFGLAMRNLALSIPVNVNDLNRIAEMGGQLGIQVPNLVSFTKTIAALGVATNLSLEEAASGLARFVNIMRTPQDQFERIGSVLVELGNKFAATESEILHFATRIAPVGKAVGATEEEILALATALSSLGIPAERGGTAIQRLFISMAQAVEQGGEDLENFADVAGVSMEVFASIFEAAPAKAFSFFVRGLNDINNSGGSVFGTLRKLGIQEQRTIQVLLASAAGWETIADAIDIANEEGKVGTALQIEAARRYGTTASQIQLLGNSFNDLRLEVGGAVLGSGGLAAAIDVLREFFVIVKDNLPVLANWTRVMAVIAALRIGAGLLQSAGAVAAMAQSFLNLRAGMSGVTRMGAAVKLTMLGINTAMTAGLAIIGILATAWALAAINAAQLRTDARNLRKELEDGADIMLALIELIESDRTGRALGLLGEGVSVFNTERLGILAKLNVSERMIVEHLMGQRDLYKELGLVTEGLDDGAIAAQEHLESLGLIGEKFPGQMRADELAFAFQVLFDVLEQAAPRVGAQLEVTRQELTSFLLDIGRTGEEAQKIVGTAMGIFGLDIKIFEFRQFVASLGQTTDAFDRLGTTGAEAGRVLGAAWEDAVFAMEGAKAPDIIDEFKDAIFDDLKEFNEGIDDQFAAIRESIIEGMPTSADYEQMAALTRKGLAQITAARDRYIEDVGAWIAAQNALQGEMSGTTAAWFESQDWMTKGAFGRLFETDPEAFRAFVNDTNAQFDELETLAGERWGTVFPEAADAGFGAMLAKLTMRTRELNLMGASLTDALIFGLQEQLMGVDEETAAIYLAWLMGIFGDTATMESLGFDSMDPLVTGMVKALGEMAERLGIVIKREAIAIETLMRGAFLAESPSKMTYAIGQDLYKGLEGGFADGISGAKFPLNVILPSRTVSPGPMTLANAMGSGYGGDKPGSWSRVFNLNINQPHVSTLDEEVTRNMGLFRSVVQLVDHGKGK